MRFLNLKAKCPDGDICYNCKNKQTVNKNRSFAFNNCFNPNIHRKCRKKLKIGNCKKQKNKKLNPAALAREQVDEQQQHYAALGCSIKASSCIRNRGPNMWLFAGESMSHTVCAARFFETCEDSVNAAATLLSSSHFILSFM